MSDDLAQWLSDPGDRGNVRAALEEARERTQRLCAGLPDAALHEAMCDYLSPPAWDMGHIANFEELWLVQRLTEAPEIHAGFNGIYNAFEHPRHERPKLRLLDRDGIREYMDEVRQCSLEVLDKLPAGSDRLLRDHFVHWMITLHEHQHQETLLQSLVMRGLEGGYTPPTQRPLPAPTAQVQMHEQDAWIDVPEGPFEMGMPPGSGVYDNESPPHDVDLEAFRIRKYPVTCGEYLAFIEDGGYTDDAHWSQRGQRWREAEGAQGPLYWYRRDGAWHRRDLRGTAPVADVADEIVCHVSYFEAEAYASWAGARLPTEAEWEKACRWEPGAGPQRNPWGDAPATTDRADVDQLGLGPSRIGAYPDGESALGVAHMIGDVWEWTASPWEPYPGFEAFPYKEYSEVFWGGDYRVLRGGSWATRAGCATGTFRNWDHPYRRQIFAGIRLADAPSWQRL